MKDIFPEEHCVIAAALPEMRAHFEHASRNAPDYAFMFDSLAHDMRQAEHAVAEKGVAASRHIIENARQSVIAIAEAPDYYGVIAGDLDAAAFIALSHRKKPEQPQAPRPQPLKL